MIWPFKKKNKYLQDPTSFFNRCSPRPCEVWGRECDCCYSNDMKNCISLVRDGFFCWYQLCLRDSKSWHDDDFMD